MAKYIEQEAAIERIENLFQLQAQTARAIIEAIHTDDVQTVRHGRWTRTSKNLMVCTACGNCVVDDRISGMFYCPNCGAKMDKEEE